VKKVGKVDGPDADKSEWIKLEFLMDPDNPALGSKYSRQFAIFKDGCKIPVDWIKWLMAFREIENPDAHEGTCRQDQGVSEFVEGSSLILL
jgi:hypothetical protein